MNLLRPRFPVALAACLALAACDGSPRAAPVVPAAPSATRAAAPAAAPTAFSLRERADRGRKLFAAECAGCHGERGLGDGPAALQLDPRPRDLVHEKFKFRSTPFGAPPLRRDILDTLENGLPGSGMPSFRFLTEEERSLLADHVRSLAGIDGIPERPAMVLEPETPAGPASIARGKAVYEKFDCAKCHGASGRGDGPSAATLVDSLERPIASRDLTTGVFRRGSTAAEINMRFRTGITGTPMPSFAENLTQEEGWDLTHFVQSLAAPKAPPPADPVAFGRRVVAERKCQACHVLEGVGGRVGPSLDVSARKLHFDWVRGFLRDPRPYGKVYPYISYRMPDLGMKPEEVEAVLALLARVAGRPFPEPAAPPVQVDRSRLAEGQLLYFLKCTECHNMGRVIPTPAAKRQGPDLILASKRLVYEWMPEWITSPQTIYPDTRMVNTNLTPEQVEAVRAFVWKTSVDAQGKP